MDTFTSSLAGFVIFSVLGFMSQQLGIDIKNVVQSGVLKNTDSDKGFILWFALPLRWHLCPAIITFYPAKTYLLTMAGVLTAIQLIFT